MRSVRLRLHTKIPYHGVGAQPREVPGLIAHPRHPVNPQFAEAD